MKRYKFLLFDADNTLLDFDENERVSISAAMERFGLSPTPELISTYSAINSKYWKMYDEGKLSQQEVLTRRFEELFALMGRECDSQAVEDFYRVQLGLGHQLIPGAKELCEDLRRDYRLYMVTNGVAATQRSRLRASGLDKLFEDIFISEEIGFHKPERGFFDYVFAHIKDFEPQRALVIGDSLSSDIAGAAAAGIDSCYLDRRGAGCGAARPTVTVSDFTALRSFLGLAD